MAAYMFFRCECGKEVGDTELEDNTKLIPYRNGFIMGFSCPKCNVLSSILVKREKLSKTETSPVTPQR